MSIPIHFQQQISRMTDEQLNKALDTHKYMQFIIEREQTRRAHGKTDDNVAPITPTDSGVELEIRQPDHILPKKSSIP